jgi:hypothetical protein
VIEPVARVSSLANELSNKESKRRSDTESLPRNIFFIKILPATAGFDAGSNEDEADVNGSINKRRSMG